MRRWEASGDEDEETSRGQSKRTLDLGAMLDTVLCYSQDIAMLSILIFLMRLYVTYIFFYINIEINKQYT